LGEGHAQVALIADPGSGRGIDPGEIAGLLRARGVRVITVKPRDPDAAVAARPDRIAVASGDGGIAPAAAAAARAGVPLAVIPVGTANDFARGAGLPDDLEAAVRLAAEGSALRALELCRIDGRPFVNAASAGLASIAGEAASGLKPALGSLAYLAGAVWSGLTGRPLQCSLRVDGEPCFEGRAWQVTVAGTGSFGAGSKLAGADPSDGLLDAAIMEAGSRLRLVRYAYGLRSGRVTEQDGVRHARGRSVELELPDVRTLNVDGELEPFGPLVRLEAEPRAFELVVPDQAGGVSPSK
jgi:diacylglycerol kinase (ATP)